MDNPGERTFTSKEELREAVWEYMEIRDLVDNPRPCHGIVPNFCGAQTAAHLLTTLPEWKKARVIFTGPDISLHQVHCEALLEGKKLLVAAPCLTGFCLLNGVPADEVLAATSVEEFALYGRSVNIDPFLPRIDLYITGAVAVDKRGNRIGKGKGGIGDREDDLLVRAGLIKHDTPRITLVHDVQLFDDFSHLMRKNDRRVSIIVTPHEVWRVAVD